jgi:hypothetical protein
MNTVDPNPDSQRLDLATAARLTKLAAMPVDMSQFDRVVQDRIPRKNMSRPVEWFKPFRVAIAASLIFGFGLAAILIGTSGGPVLASTTELAQLHNELVSRHEPTMQVDSMQAANHALFHEWSEAPKLPNLPNDQVMACCIRSIKSKKVACVLLKCDGERVTMAFANASEMQRPSSPAVTDHGSEYHLQSTSGLNMVTTRRNGLWICLISKFPPDKLIQLASRLQF